MSPSDLLRFTTPLLVLVVPLVGTTSASAQVRVLPERSALPVILGDPREPALGAKLVFVTRGATQFGTGVEGEATIGATVPFLEFPGTDDNRVVVGLQGGVFGRFQMETIERDLISSDWMFSVPVVFWRGPHWFRFRYRHQSSHLGDEYIGRFTASRSDYSRDAIGVTAYRQLRPAFGVYAGADAAFNVEPDNVDPLMIRFGGVVRDTRPGGGPRLYGAADVTMDQDANWDARLNAQLGLSIFPGDPRNLRFIVEFMSGPSPQGEFHRIGETFVTLGLYFDVP